MVRHVIAFMGLVGCLYTGQFMVQLFALPFPGALMGLLLLLGILMVMGKVPESLDRVAQLLLKHLSIFFIPATLAVVLYKEQLQDQLGLLALTLVGTTAFSLMVTSWLSRKVWGTQRFD